MEKLEATVPYDVIDNCEEWGLNIPVNMFFSDGFAIDGMTLPQMYAVCRRLIDTMAILCSDEEKADCMAFMNNKYIWEILCDPKEGLESTTLEYYYYPKYFEELLIESEGMKRLAQGKRAGNAVDENECDLIKDKLNKKADQVRELICKESDIFCDKEVLVGRFIKLLTCIEQEYFYCKGVSEVLSDRADPDKNTFAEGGIEDLEEDMDPFTECFEFIGGE